MSSVLGEIKLNDARSDTKSTPFWVDGTMWLVWMSTTQHVVRHGVGVGVGDVLNERRFSIENVLDAGGDIPPHGIETDSRMLTLDNVPQAPAIAIRRMAVHELAARRSDLPSCRAECLGGLDLAIVGIFKLGFPHTFQG